MLPGLLHRAEDRGEALAGRQFRDQGQLRARFLKVRDRADAGEERMTEPRERVYSRAQRRLEPRLRDKLVAESKQLETWSGVVEEEETVAQSIEVVYRDLIGRPAARPTG